MSIYVYGGHNHKGSIIGSDIIIIQLKIEIAHNRTARLYIADDHYLVVSVSQIDHGLNAQTRSAQS